jgi:G3E family GTPase
VIEASGVADPAKIAHYAASHPRLALDSIVVVADAETVEERSHDKYVGDLVRLQLAAADMIVLSKTDLVDADACRRVRQWIEAELPQARILAGPDAGSFADLLLMDRAERVPPLPAPDGDHGRMFTTWTFVRQRPLEGAALRAAVAALPPAVVRAKGIVRLREAPDRRFVLQLVGRRWSLEGVPGPRALSDRSEIVCIGPADQLDPASLEALFADVAPAAVTPAIRGLLRGENRR